MIVLRFSWPQVLLRVSWNLSLGVYISLSLMALVATLLLPYETKGRAMQVSNAADKSFIRSFFPVPVSFVIRFNLSQSLPSLFLFGVLLPLWCFSTLVSCYFEAFFDLKKIVYIGKTDLIHRDMFRDLIGKKVHGCKEKNGIACFVRCLSTTK